MNKWMYVCGFIYVMYVLYSKMYGLVEMIVAVPPIEGDFSFSELKSILASAESTECTVEEVTPGEFRSNTPSKVCDKSTEAEFSSSWMLDNSSP